MIVKKTRFKGLLIIKQKNNTDARGSLRETFNNKKLKKKFAETKFKCPLIHFVPPTIWAYGKSRIKKWENLHDGLFCLFKNEEDIFRKFNIKCSYVGNPIVEKFLRNKHNEDRR